MNNFDTKLPLAYLENLAKSSADIEQHWLNIIKWRDMQINTLREQIEKISSSLEDSEKECLRLRHILVDNIIMPKTPLIDGRYQISDEGFFVKDIKSGLIWRRYVETGKFKYEKALAQAEKEGFITERSWRVPTIEELKTLIEEKHHNPAINAIVFPNTPGEPFWSSSPHPNNTESAWNVNFYDGHVNYDSRTNAFALRLVRYCQ